jgi:ubiquinone/menaquinone biosynthesis C-methylase UbiE
VKREPAVRRGKPFPASLATLIDNPLVRAMSGTHALIRRADIKQGMRVLDAGCGPGRLTIPLARHVGPSGEVIPLDLQDGMLRRVRRRAAEAGLSNVRTVLAPLDRDISVLQGDKGTIDRAVLVTVLGEVPGPLAALQGIHALLRPGGILSITEILIDPDYTSRRAVSLIATRAGFQHERTYGTLLAFTMTFRK